MKPLIGVCLVGLGLLSGAHWLDRAYFRPTSEDRQRDYQIADGTPSELLADNKKIFLLAGVALLVVGSGMISNSRK